MIVENKTPKPDRKLNLRKSQNKTKMKIKHQIKVEIFTAGKKISRIDNACNLDKKILFKDKGAGMK